MELLDTKIESNGFIFYGKFSEGLFQEWLKITTILASKSDLQNELLFQVGFSIYKLIEVEKQQFRLFSIDYEANPFKDFTEDLTVALWIQSEQASLAKELQINPTETRFDDKILIAKGVFEDEHTYLQRQNTQRQRDSGWFMGYQRQDNEDFVGIHAFELLKWNPKLIKVLVLPTDYLVIVNDGEIHSILNDCDEEIFPIS